MAATTKRGISQDFMDDLMSEKGILNPLLKAVRLDDTLSLYIRSNYINIYYRGGSLVEIAEQQQQHRYKLTFDMDYLKAEQFGVSHRLIVSLPRIICSLDEAVEWVTYFPQIKCVMDMYLHCVMEKREREFQQIVERVNNSNSSTDYFICDIEYTNTVCDELRADLIALHWPSKSPMRKRLDCGKLAIIEMKHGDDALKGKSGIVEHIRQLDNAAIAFSDLCEEVRVVFNQRVELGLIQCHDDGNIRPKLQTINSDEPIDYIILLSDHDPASQRLIRELKNLTFTPSRVKIRVALATFMGYGLYDESIYDLDEFLTCFPEQICSRSSNGDGSDVVDVQDEIEDVLSGDCLNPNQAESVRMCEMCHVRPATEDRLETWTVNTSNPAHHHLCSECSRSTMY